MFTVRSGLQQIHAMAAGRIVTVALLAFLIALELLALAGHVSERRVRLAPFPRVDRNLESLRQASDYIALTSGSGRYVSPAAEWLRDNFHLVEAQLQQIRKSVARSYYARLPKLAAQPLADQPRVYGIAWAYVAHTDSVLNNELFTAFLNAYQEVGELTLGELWALPTTLRVVLLENLRRVAETIAAGKVGREVAHAAWDASPSLSEQDLDAIYAALLSRGLAASYLTQLWQRHPVERTGHGQPDGRQHHHDAAHDRPGRVGRPDRAGEPGLCAYCANCRATERKANSPANRSRMRWSRLRAPRPGPGVKWRLPSCNSQARLRTC